MTVFEGKIGYLTAEIELVGQKHDGLAVTLDDDRWIFSPAMARAWANELLKAANAAEGAPGGRVERHHAYIPAKESKRAFYDAILVEKAAGVQRAICSVTWTADTTDADKARIIEGLDKQNSV